MMQPDSPLVRDTPDWKGKRSRLLGDPALCFAADQRASEGETSEREREREEESAKCPLIEW